MEEEQKVPLAVFYAYDREDFDLYTHALGYYLALCDMKDELRSKVKYGHQYTSIEDCLEKLYDKLYELRVENHLPED